jgi:hypothetical protein
VEQGRSGDEGVMWVVVERCGVDKWSGSGVLELSDQLAWQTYGAK